MYRYTLSDLIIWAKQETPKPLILRGARQVGKSTLVNLLSKKLDLELLEIKPRNSKIK